MGAHVGFDMGASTESDRLRDGVGQRANRVDVLSQKPIGRGASVLYADHDQAVAWEAHPLGERDRLLRMNDGRVVEGRREVRVAPNQLHSGLTIDQNDDFPP